MRTTSISRLLGVLLAISTIVASDDPKVQIDVTVPATCSRKTQNGDVLSVHYKGTLQSNGQQFDTSYGGQPFKFKLGAHEVISGWDQGLLDMCIGESRTLTIPPELGYGSRGSPGAIPPNSVLIFETTLLGIDGVKMEKPASDNANSTDTSITDQKGSEAGPMSEDNDGECKLLGQFAILIQAALGALALLALVWKRWRERPQRPALIWFYDVSKQVVGSFLIHFANLFLSMLSSGSLEIQSSATNVGNHSHPNPCSFYLLNLAIDTTIGIPILVFFLRCLHWIFLKTPLANPPESLTSGNYGNPPRFLWWLKQVIIYFMGLFCMKVCVFLLFVLFPALGWVGDWALRWTEGKEWVQILFVMLIFPLIMNAAQYWIIDSFIKDKNGEYGFMAVDQTESSVDDDDEHRVLVRGDSVEGQDTGVVASKKNDDLVWKGDKEPKNGLPNPQDFESDVDEHDPRVGSSGSSR